MGARVDWLLPRVAAELDLELGMPGVEIALGIPVLVDLCRARSPRARQNARMRLGVVILPELPWSTEGREAWTRAEAMGFTHAWTYDHLAWRGLRDSAWFGAVPILAAAAAATSRIRLGPLVASPNFRHPVVFARDVLAIDDVSNGRITVGVGAGGLGWDTTILGEAPLTAAERADRFEEFVALLDRLLTQREVSYQGRYFQAVDARSHPGCVQQPRTPFAIAATGPRGMRLAARHATVWVTTGNRHRDPGTGAAAGSRDVADQIARLDEACSAVGRDPATIDRLVLTGPVLDPGLGSEEQFGDTIGHYRHAGATDLVVHWPRPGPPYRADPGRFETVLTPHLVSQ